MKTILYTVKEGEKLCEIASRFHSTEAAVRIRNNLKGQPFGGMKLLIEEQEAEVYTVRPFDNLQSIASKFSTSVEKLKRLNALDEVFVGQRILVPKKKHS